MLQDVKGYLIGSKHEVARQANIQKLLDQLPQLSFVEAIYPSNTKIPFKAQLIELSYQRTGHALSNGELGCLLTHRKIWRLIANQKIHPNQHYLILESDSNIVNIDRLCQHFMELSNQFDIFFWGAWEGHMKLYKSTINKGLNGIHFGQAYLKSVYCTYGYALSPVAAQLLLQRTNKIAYPVDQFKHWIAENELRIGGTQTEIISTIGKKQSYIQHNRHFLREFFWWIVLDFKNSIICYFK